MLHCVATPDGKGFLASDMGGHLHFLELCGAKQSPASGHGYDGQKLKEQPWVQKGKES
jgi:hypothetical protein